MTDENEKTDHYGCPECGCSKFDTRRTCTHYGSEKVFCEWTTTEKGEEPDYDAMDYGDFDCHDSDSGDSDMDYNCEDCGHVYSEPKFYSAKSNTENLAEESGMCPDEVKELQWLLDSLHQAQDMTILVMPHATIVEAVPKEEQRGQGSQLSRWMVVLCCLCSAELSEPRPRIRQVYKADPATGSRSKVYDRRQLPVLLQATLCGRCW